MLLVVALCGCGGGAFAPPTAAKTPSSSGNATVSDNIQQLTGWLTCGNCGNTGATGATATYTMTRGITSPSESGSSAQFSIGGPNPYSNAYWYYRHQAPNAAMSSLIYEFDLFLPGGSENAPQAIEFECQQRLDGYVYNFAWQADYVSNHWRVFNFTAKHWEDSGIPLQRFSPNSWHHIVAEYHNNAATHTTFHDALSVDGERHPLTITHLATPTTTTGGDFTNAFQLDLNGAPAAYSVYVDRMKVTQVD